MRFAKFTALAGALALAAASMASGKVLFSSTTGFLRLVTYNSVGQGTQTPYGQLVFGDTVVGIGDFDQNGFTDVVVKHTQPSGDFYRLYLYDATGRVGNVGLIKAGQVATVPVGVGDFDGDGNLEFVLEDQGTGRLQANEVDHTTFAVNDFSLGIAAVGAYNRAVGIGDMNGDGSDDVVIINPANNMQRYMYYTGTAPTSLSGPIKSNTGDISTPGSPTVGATDIDADGNVDLILQPTDSTRRIRAWLMVNTTVKANIPLASLIATKDYNVVAVGK